MLQTLKFWITEDVEREIKNILEELDKSIYISKSMNIFDSINTTGMKSVIDSYFEPDYEDYDDDYYHRTSDEVYISEIEAIFER